LIPHRVGATIEHPPAEPVADLAGERTRVLRWTRSVIGVTATGHATGMSSKEVRTWAYTFPWR
jgi:hypothetical protein